MKKNIANAALLILAILFLSVLAFYVRIGSTANSVAVLKTTGMTCGSCSRRISTELEKLQGVATTEVDVAGARVIVGYDAKAVKVETLAETVRGAGFGSSVHVVMTQEQYRQATGRDIGQIGTSSGCCGGASGGCGVNRR